jgi:integrase
MARIPKFAYRKTPRGWLVNSPATLTLTGRRERAYFSNRDDAKEHAAKLREKFLEHGGNAQAITPSLAEAATTAERMLEPLGISLLEAVQRFVAGERLLEPLGISLPEAVRRFVTGEQRARASVTMERAIAEFRAAGGDPIDAKDAKAYRGKGRKWSDSQATAYRLRGDKLTEAFSGRLISSITGEELRKHLEATTGGAGSYNQALRLVRAIWRWCAKPPRKWCDTEAVEHLEGRDAVSGEIGVLSHKQALAVMRAAETYLPETVPAFAIALFTGMRAAEIDRLTPANIAADGITVPAVSAKTKRRRFIQMPEPLAAWLKRYPIGETVTPADWRRKQIAVRRLAGFRVWSDLVPRLDLKPKQEATPPDDLPEWPDNALRHTAATVAVAMGKSIETLTFEHGHVGGLEMLRRHYVGALPKAEALKIWAIAPTPKRGAKGKKTSHLRVA